MISEFYYGMSWHWPLKHVPRVMLSYNFTRTLKKPWEINIPFMLDSGAFSVILKYGKYPYPPEQYAESIRLWQPDIAWTMDYPCEPSVRKAGSYDPARAQEMTVDNQIRLLDLNVKTQMVVQGWTIHDYLENLDRIKDQGLLTERLGIGSICRRGEDKEITRIVKAIHNNVPSWVKLHGFGVKTSFLGKEGKFFLYSADSMSWAYSWRNFNRNQRTQKEKMIGLRRYIENIEPILLSNDPLLSFQDNFLKPVLKEVNSRNDGISSTKNNVTSRTETKTEMESAR